MPVLATAGAEERPPPRHVRSRPRLPGRCAPAAGRDNDAVREDADASLPSRVSTDGAWARGSTLARPPAPPDDAPGGAPLKELILSRLFAASGPPRIGRFTLLGLLGEGGMGVVYAAYDEALDRKVAIKLLRAGGSDLQRARMLREAKLMAQLSHPNVITVHEVGPHEDQIFIAMEFIRGEPLDRVLQKTGSGEQPDWRAALALYAQAGAGLLAAHRAGLVHRDFKPQNVMVTSDGVVKVLDFGLAREAVSEDLRRSSEERRDRDLPPAPPPTSLTQTGAVMGTPAYMAPEQHLGLATDERTDQFSFCVALWESLYGQHPFLRDTFFALQAAVLGGHVRDPPANSPVPARVRRLLLRGLSVRPEDRHPSLAELLADLARDPGAARRRWLAAGALVLAASGATYALSHTAAAPPTCVGIDDELAAVWHPARRDAVAAALRATGVPYAEDTWARVGPALDDYARRWTELRARACHAHAEARESDRLYDLRTACLARRRSALDALVGLLAQASASDVENAARALAELPPLTTCDDTEALTAALPPPEDPALAAAVEEHRGTLARAREYEALGRFAEARALVDPVLGSPEAAAYPPLAAEASLALGAVDLAAARYEPATAALSRAIELGLRAGHLDVAAEAYARRIFTQAQSGATTEALHDLLPAGALADRSRSRQIRWLLENNTGVLYGLLRRFDESRERFLAALATKRELDGEEHLEFIITLGNLSSIEVGEGNAAQALRHLEETLTLAERVLGASHPTTTQMRYGLARAEHLNGRLEAAHARMTTSLAALAKVYGPDAESLFPFYLALAALDNDRGAFAESLEILERASAILARHDLRAHQGYLYLITYRALALAGVGRGDHALVELDREIEAAQVSPRPAQTAELYDARGRIALARGDTLRALESFRRALEAWKGAESPPPMLIVSAELRLSEALRAAGDPSAALALAAALAHAELSPPRDSAWLTAEIHLRLGEALIADGRPREALDRLKQLREALAPLAEPQNPTLARINLAAARAEHELGDVSAARTHAREALAALRTYEPSFARERAALEALLWALEKNGDETN